MSIFGIDLRFNQQRIGFGNNKHDRIAGGDDAADGVGGGLKDDAVLRRADIGAFKLILGGNLALNVFADLAIGLAQLLGDVAGQVLIDLQHLQFGLSDFALGLGGGSNELPAFALQPRRFTFQCRQLVDPNKVLFPQFAHAAELLLDQFRFLGFGGLFRLESADLFLKLSDPLPQLLLLSQPRGPP